MAKVHMRAVDVKIETYYNLDGSYVSFPQNPLNGTMYNNANVDISTEKRTIAGMTFLVDVVQINNEPAIECELVKTRRDNKTLVLGVCQDWG
jgi:hypothetical protein